MTKHFGALCSSPPHAFGALQDVKYTWSSSKMNTFGNPFLIAEQYFYFILS